MIGLSEKLTQRLDAVRSFSLGICAEDVKKLGVDAPLIEDVMSCLRSSESADQSIALFFAGALFQRGLLNPDQELELVAAILPLLTNEQLQVNAAALGLLVGFSELVPEYRSIMLAGLVDASPLVRKQALLAFTTYGSLHDIGHLERFESDDYLAETNMGGPLVYELRNLALKEIEVTVGRTFRRHEMTEILETGELAYWWSWSDFRAWSRRPTRRWQS